jgi:hypothetical protein
VSSLRAFAFAHAPSIYFAHRKALFLTTLHLAHNLHPSYLEEGEEGVVVGWEYEEEGRFHIAMR